MTKQKFYKELKKVAPLFKWVENTKGHIRAIDANNHHYCPLTALYFVKKGRRIHINAVDLTGQCTELGDIVAGADNWDRKEKAILMKTVGLK